MNKYIERVLAETKAKNDNEPEFLQTVEEVLSSLDPPASAGAFQACRESAGHAR